MSFSSDLWKGFDILYEQFKLYNSELKHLYLVFHEITQIEKEYSKGMKYICSFSNKMQLGGSLGSALSEFYNELNTIADNHNNYALSLSNTILTPLRERIGKAKEIQFSFMKNEKNETAFNQTINQLINFQEKFHLATKELSVAVTGCEVAKVNENIKKSMKNKFLSAQNKKMEVAKKAEAEYINKLSEANNHREQFNQETKEILDNLQKQNKQIIDCIQSILLIYSKTISEEINKLSKSNEKLQKKYEEIEGEKDIKEFIQTNATKVFPFYKFEFISYKPANITTVVSENLKEEASCVVDKKTIVANVKRFISTELKYTAPKPEQKISQEFEEIETATNMIWKNGKIDSIKKKIFDLHLTKKSHMNCFIKCLNQFRAHGDFILSEDAYNTLSELFISILNNEIYQKDYNVLKNLIILSQTFYKIIQNKKEPKQLIQTAIQSHPIWTNWKTWEEIIKYSIGEQDKTTRDNVLFNKKVESNKDRLRRLNQFAKNTLVSYLCNMILFNIKDDVCSEVRDFICKVYNLDENEIIEQVVECSKTNTEEESQPEKSKGGVGGKNEDNGNENKASDNTRSSTEELKNSDKKKDNIENSSCINGETNEKGISQIEENKNNKVDTQTENNINKEKEKVEVTK